MYYDREAEDLIYFPINDDTNFNPVQRSSNNFEVHNENPPNRYSQEFVVQTPKPYNVRSINDSYQVFNMTNNEGKF